MSTYTYLIAGGGTTAGYAVKALVEHGAGKGEIGIVSAEETLPVDRPPLSKGYLAGDKADDEVLVNPARFYSDNGIDVHLGTTISRVDLDGGAVEVERGGTFAYDKLLIATGARPKRLHVEGAEEAPIHYLRTVNHARAIRDEGARCKKPLVIGGGFIGMEVAAGLATMGKHVRLVHGGPHLMPHIFTQPMAGFFEGYYRERNVEIVNGENVASFSSEDGKTVVTLESGTALDTDFIVAGVGVDVNTELFDGTPLEVDDGIAVNEFLETGVTGVYAAGDVARYVDPRYGRSLRVEHWQNAHDQGARAAASMAGQREAFSPPPYFFSDMFDLSWEFWGDIEGADEALHVGDLEHGSFSVWWAREGRVVASFVLNRIDEERQRAKASVAEGREVPRDIAQRGNQARHG